MKELVSHFYKNVFIIQHLYTKSTMADITLDSNLVKSKNCVGTVISLNGHRRYFCIYHARHPECISDSGGKVIYFYFELD